MKQLVIDALSSAHANNIAFAFTGSTGLQINITVNGFRSVIRAIRQDDIKVERGGGVPDGMAKYTAQDDGNSKANTMYLGKNTTTPMIRNSLLVHESVHAIFDLNRQRLPWLDNEVAAYIAQGFYLKNAGFKPGGKKGLSEEAYLGLHVAESFETIGEDPFWLENLQNSLLSNPVYHGYIRGEFRGDG